MLQLLLFIAAVALAFVVVRTRARRQSLTFAFFHPYCHAGGGGERVLWTALRAMQIKHPSLRYVVFSGDVDASREEILLRAKERFGIELPEPARLQFVFLRSRRLVEADLYPVLTMALQSFGGFLLGVEALYRFNPEVLVDTMGYAFILPLFRWVGGARCAAYVHYPTVSTDMIEAVASRAAAFNNAGLIARSKLLSTVKLYYYRAFALAYGLVGRAAELVMVNGSWTRGHIVRLWGAAARVHLVFPPCAVDELLAVRADEAERLLSEEHMLTLLSVGQIRPEKNHAQQLRVLAALQERAQPRGVKVRLSVAGGCRNEEDVRRVDELKEMAERLGVEVDWQLNVRYERLLSLFSESLIGVHTMRNEHFGIAVVESLAAGCLTVAHASAGPAMDIVGEELSPAEAVGALADTDEQYVEAVWRCAFVMTRAEREAMRERARRRASRFDEPTFERAWLEAISPLLPSSSA